MILVENCMNKKATSIIRELLFGLLMSIVLFLAMTPGAAIGQNISGFTDYFNNNSLDTLWNGKTVPLWGAYSNGSNDPNHTFALSEGNGVLTINYNRDAQSGPWDGFYFQPPADIDVSQTPSATLDIKSDIAMTYSFKPIYANGQNDFISQNVPGDNKWHTYTFNFASGHIVTEIFMYFNGGSTASESGKVEFDNFKVAGFSVNISSVKATDVDSSHVNLSWSVDKPDAVKYFNIYRNTNATFKADSSSWIGDTTATVYHDRGLMNNTVYYYKITAVDTTGEEHAPSSEASALTSIPGVPPTVQVDSTNSDQVGKYDMFEVTLGLQNASYQNPYDPDQIDVHAYFKSPSGDTTWVNGFYDNYNNAHAWRVRFAPNEVGTWEYQAFATTTDGTGKSAKKTFTAVPSTQHGWITVSKQNSNYLAYTDSTTFYGMAAYYPWSVTQSGLDELKQHHVNIIGYWNSTYDNAGNGGGAYLIESLRSGLGHYDQQKCGRIDQLLGWLHSRNMKMMFALWPHDFLSSGPPWNETGYTTANPYQTIVSASNFYGDSLAWVYQKKLYRYIIARWGYSTSMGIWEIVNEIHGTTGWINHRDQAIAWVNKVDAYFKQHDPHDRPTTASFGSSTIFSGGTVNVDMPNRHYYEAQGYPRPYGNNVRDGLYDAVNVMTDLKKAGNKPAIFGEAGYTSMFSSASSADYTQEMHDAFWAGLANGLASTPFWWDFTTKTVFTPARLDLYNKLQPFADSLYLAKSQSNRFTILGSAIYGYGRQNDSTAFGWMYSYSSSNNISGTPLQLINMKDGTYAVTWYNTWDGTDVAVDTTISVGHLMNAVIPQLATARKDIAVKLRPIPGGTKGTILHLLFKDTSLVATQGASYDIVAYVTDDQGRLVMNQSHDFTFKLTGPGSLANTSIKTTNGIAVIKYQPPADLIGGNITVTVESNGLKSATIQKVVTDVQSDNQQTVPDKFKLGNNYPNPFNPTTNIQYSLSKPVHVQLKVYNMLGQLVATLVDQKQTTGNYQVTFHANRFASGIYIYRLQAGNFVQTKKMTLLK